MSAQLDRMITSLGLSAGLMCTAALIAAFTGGHLENLGSVVDSATGSTRAEPSAAVQGSALEQLDSLPRKGRAPKTGYDADASFGPSWSDASSPSVDGARNGCDTRNDLLRRDLKNTSIKPNTTGCVVIAGELADPYGGGHIQWQRGPSSSTVQIDHVVAKSNAWTTGAQQLSEQQRTDFANDPLNLLAVDGPLNSSKGDGDAATWLPPAKSFRCQYVARQVAVKAKHELWVTPAEGKAMERVLNNCPDQPRGDRGTAWKVPPP